MRGQVRLAQGDKSVVVDAYDVFVNIDLGRNVAYIAYVSARDCDGQRSPSLARGFSWQ